MPTEPTPYLIAHRVRGERAFDVAIQLQIGDELGWIIPTSGHRAYPYWSIGLDDLGYCGDVEVFGDGSYNCPRPITDLVGPVPDDLRDHYQVSEKRVDAMTDVEAARILKEIGL